MKPVFTILSTIIFISFSINANGQSISDDIDISNGSYGVIDITADFPSVFADDGFVKYTKIQCPNGEAIHFVAQDQIRLSQIVRARTILEFYLNSVPDSQYGDDKDAVKNTMGINDAVLLLMNGSDGEGSEPSVFGQPLFENEMAVEGHSWYQENDFDHRDASFEEILHMMHDMGIGVDGSNSISNPALPDFQQVIRSAQENAHLNNFEIWPIGADADESSWYNELDAENSLSQEYLASLIDSYYGLWEPWTEDPNTGMWGIYIAHDREEIETEDPMGWALLPLFFSPVIDVDMIIDPELNTVFSMERTEESPYTFKSQYLQHAYLSGSNDGGLKGNALYNRLTGNQGNNTLEGQKGNDRLDGFSGNNTAIFSGVISEYTIENLSSYAIVSDNVEDRDGVDTLWNINQIQFSDLIEPLELIETGLLDNSSFSNDLMVYPNPTRNLLTVEVGNSLLKGEVTVLNQLGQEAIRKRRTDNLITSIDVSKLENGLYIIEIHTNEVTMRKKFIKE